MNQIKLNSILQINLKFHFISFLIVFFLSMHILLGISGSVASIKTAMLVDGLEACGHQVKVVATTHALHFIDANGKDILTDQDEWKTYQQRGDPVLHIEVRILYEEFDCLIF
jgi:phosphopantothenoylcysteine synthetase/decarboxylase